MTIYSAFAILISLCAGFAYINHRFIRLPYTIGLMFLALITSLLLVVAGEIFPQILETSKSFLGNFDFSDLLLGSMLSFMLFAGSIHININDLKKEKFSIILFSTFSVIISTFIIGTSVFYLVQMFGLNINFILCLLFGALISPTDPIAVLGILKEARIPKLLEVKIAGESLFNDGIAVVVFLTILEIEKHPGDFQWTDVALLFIREAFGGVLWGIIIGYTGYLLIRGIDNYKVEVLITIAVVMGGYSLANVFQVSGPLAMVAAGIVIGNQAKKLAMSDNTAEYVDKFWELVDEILNAILFVLMGLVLLTIHFAANYFLMGLVSIIIVLITRYISVFIPAQFIKLKENISRKTLVLLTWGGLRGGISIAMALSLKPEMHKELWLTMTYFIVAFSILIQGLTIGKLVKTYR